MDSGLQPEVPDECLLLHEAQKRLASLRSSVLCTAVMHQHPPIATIEKMSPDYIAILGHMKAKYAFNVELSPRVHASSQTLAVRAAALAPICNPSRKKSH